MRSVGLRELKSRLSYYIRQVRAGRHVLVTDRGQVVAELSPPGEAPATESQVPAGLAAMARRGLVTLGAGKTKRDAYPELPAALKPGRVAELLNDERGTR